MSESSGTHGSDEQRWRQLLRGAFSIPSLVSDESALEAVALLLLHPDVAGALDPDLFEEHRKDARKIVDAFVRLGGEDKLDHYLVRLDLSSASDWDGQAEEVLEAEILRESAVSNSGDHLQAAVRHLVEVAMTLARNPTYLGPDRHDGGSWIERRADRRRRQ